MATLIGVVSQVVGEVFAVAGDGTRRLLIEGDRVFAGEQLVTGAAGAVAIALASGGELTLGRDSNQMLDTQVLADMRGDGVVAPASAAPTAPSDQDLADIEQLQAAIEAGVDPSAALAATAAGPGAGGADGGGGHSFILLSETAGALDPVIGFPTEGLSFVPEFPDPDIEQLDEQSDEPPIIPQIILGERQTVSESALATGSNSASDGEFASGTFRLSHAGGLSVLQSLSINGVTVSIVSLVGVSVVAEHGTLSITGYDGTTGLVSYSYELTSPANSSSGNQTSVFALSVSDGMQSSTPTNLIIEIFDDVPNAVDDSNSIAEDSVAPITGSVLDNDLHANGQPGADTPTSFVGWASTAASYGTFSDTGNGTYSYSLNNVNPAVQSLAAGESLSETFSYTMQDADGDTDTATLTITVLGSNDGPGLSVDPGNQGGNDQVFEAGLANGSNAGVSSIVASGAFTLSDADGLDDLQSVTINGVTVAIGSLAGSVFAGSNGNLTIDSYNAATGVASYSYQLTSPTTDGPGIESDNFTLSVSDGTASSAPASIVIEIVDDVPHAVDDSNSIAEDSVAPI
ncbi:retention module-containing protein, partial [Pseudomonas sp. sp1636]|uniref:retention module-containing protein n=1 Tax=Pseudomonas sp. sp1636 TaxID=3036707 RepID=UPI0025A54B87